VAPLTHGLGSQTGNNQVWAEKGGMVTPRETSTKGSPNPEPSSRESLEVLSVALRAKEVRRGVAIKGNRARKKVKSAAEKFHAL